MILHRLKEYIDAKGLTIASFERSVGMSNASFGKSLKNNGAIGSDKLENILSVYPDINPVWLLTGKGTMQITDAPLTTSPLAQPAENALLYKMYQDKEAKVEAQAEEIGRLKQLLDDLKLHPMITSVVKPYPPPSMVSKRGAAESVSVPSE